MAATTIEWTNRSWNPLRGCEHVSEGCRFCYAECTAARFSGEGKPFDGLAEFKLRELPRPDGALRLLKVATWTGKIKLLEDEVDKPKRWRKPALVFLASMTDVFHKDVPDEFILRLFETMDACDRHRFQVLTKRPERLLQPTTLGPGKLYERLPWPDHVLLGTSVEDHKVVHRIDTIRAVTAAKHRWLSVEPLIGPLGDVDLSGIEWVVCGGESGTHAREMKIAWMRDVLRQCEEQAVAFFAKQLGSVQSKVLLGRDDKGSKSFAEWPPYLHDIQIREWPPVLELKENGQPQNK